MTGFYHNPPERTIPNRVPKRTEGYGRLQFNHAIALFLPQNTQNPASPDTEGGWGKMSSRHFNHNPVTGNALRRVHPVHPAHAHTHFSHKSGIGPAREVPTPPSARGVRTRLPKPEPSRGRVATCCDRLGNRPTPNMRSAPASGRLTRSARRHGDTEDFESWLTHTSITFLHWRKEAGSCEAHLFPASSVSPEGRFCVFCGKKHPSKIDKAWMKQRASQPRKPLSESPCLRTFRVNQPKTQPLQETNGLQP